MATELSPELAQVLTGQRALAPSAVAECRNSTSLGALSTVRREPAGAFVFLAAVLLQEPAADDTGLEGQMEPVSANCSFSEAARTGLNEAPKAGYRKRIEAEELLVVEPAVVDTIEREGIENLEEALAPCRSFQRHQDWRELVTAQKGMHLWAGEEAVGCSHLDSAGYRPLKGVLPAYDRNSEPRWTAWHGDQVAYLQCSS